MIAGARRLLAALTFTVLCTQSMQAQGTPGRIAGRVRETASQGPLANVAVTIVGSTVGALTRPDGSYQLAMVPPGTVTLKFARIGYTAKEVVSNVVAGEATTVDVALDAVATQLAGVVTVGYGTREARDRTGVVETVTERSFNTGRVISPEQLIQAKVPGVQVVDNNEPGGGISIRIRGGTSINASNEPLFVVDGVPLQVGGGVSAGRNPLNFLNPGDIETVSVLKDASATAIYGSRGANGVVIITTKSGGNGTQVSYGSSFSNSTVSRAPEFLDAAAYRAAVAKYAPENVNKLGTANTNWRDLIQRSAMGGDHNLAVSGGKDAMRYRLALNVLDQDGILRGTTARRYSASLNYSDRMFNDQLEIKTSLKGSRNDDLFTPGGVLGAATAMAPTQAVQNANGSFFQWSDALGANNPLSDLALLSDKGTTYRSLGNVEAKYRIPRVDGLAMTVRAGYDFTQSARTQFSPSTAQQDVESGRGGRFDRNNPRQVNTLLEVFGDYARRFEGLKTDFDVTAGYTNEQSHGDFSSFFAQKLSSNLLGENGVPGAETQANFLDVQDSKLISGFARTNFTLNGKYLLTASVRKDGSSRFGEGNQWGVFPSAAVAWRVIDEPFLKGKTPLSDLKLRYSWGVNGNQAFGNYLFVSTYSTSGAQALVQFGNQFINMIRPSAVDPNIKWEETTSNNVGLDFGLMDGRISATVDYYQKNTTDLIFNVPVPAGTNLSNFVTTNIGSLQNRGIEVGLNARVFESSQRTGFTWDANVNFASNTNKVAKISGTGSDAILVGGIAGGVGNTVQVLKPGFPINSFFVYKHKVGADGLPVSGDKTDKELYEDMNGDGNVNFDDRVAYKSPAPKMIIGHTSSMSFRNFDMALTARAYLGNYVYNNVASNLGNYAALKGAAPANLYAAVSQYNFVKPQYFSDVYVEDASFLRLDNITLGYTFPKLRQFDGLRVFGTVQNVFTASKYSGVDPQAGVNGIDNNIFPMSRTFTAGFRIGF